MVAIDTSNILKWLLGKDTRTPGKGTVSRGIDGMLRFEHEGIGSCSPVRKYHCLQRLSVIAFVFRKEIPAERFPKPITDLLKLVVPADKS